MSDQGTAADGGAAVQVTTGDAGGAAMTASAPRDAGGAPSSPVMLDAAAASGGAAPAMPCAPGMYSGTFEGSVTYVEGSLSSIAGTVQAELMRDASGQDLTVSAGEITGVSDGTRMTSKWTGTLSCQTRQLENATQAGAWENGSSFSGVLEGTYSERDNTIIGTWQVRSDLIPFAGGRGDFRMVLSARSDP